MEELWGRLFRVVILFATFFVIGFFFAGPVLKKILEFVHLDQVTIAASSPFQFIEIAMDFGFFLAIMVCVPYIIYSFYSFIVPALTKNEQIKLLKSIPLSAALFIVGFSYGFFILNYALEALASVNISLGIANFWNVGQFLSQIVITSALLGFIFEFPLLLSLLIKLGIITPEILKKQRRIAYFLMFSFTALLPPTDVLSLIAMALPLMLLYEVTILLNKNKHHVWTLEPNK
ncbi:MAG: Sec-independent protein translocase, TatC subunit [Candidatus Yanofskybacteria bacterium GW2011_GWA1_39_13]|uniref:Sec-independent protein translocase protein TatC n=1 Tax=Yanofskybacteria sp. (strain GW2011_GWA1_39_13) TaxID=1619019 RepID=A0A0G0MG42_YANXG|nr:MAG: Sec-independent protein translocase, TatC subunit [Candidatus Yanofskybacteria bacterium GW2011_GWA1_39_13]